MSTTPTLSAAGIVGGGFVTIINYAGGHGGHINPATSFLLLDEGNFELLDGSQFLLFTNEA